jgi:hypothetical protein
MPGPWGSFTVLARADGEAHCDEQRVYSWLGLDAHWPMMLTCGNAYREDYDSRSDGGVDSRLHRRTAVSLLLHLVPHNNAEWAGSPCRAGSS